MTQRKPGNMNSKTHGFERHAGGGSMQWLVVLMWRCTGPGQKLGLLVWSVWPVPVRSSQGVIVYLYAALRPLKLTAHQSLYLPELPLACQQPKPRA